MRSVSRLLVIVILGIAAGAVLAEKIPNWAAPGTFTPSPADPVGGVKVAFGGGGGYWPLPFIPLTPCRVVDTRGNGFAGEWGPPSMPGGGTQRSFTIGGQCGIPANATAVSFNFTVWAPPTGGDIRVFPTGGATPTAATMLYQGGVLGLSNAAVAPLGTFGRITVQVDGPGTINLIVDVNGYYSEASAGGAGMTLTATAGTALTLNVTGIGNGLNIDANTMGASLVAYNAATGCSGVCGGFFLSDSPAPGTIALQGTARTTSRSVGVNGVSAGLGTNYTTGLVAAGVLGQASNTGSAYAHGVVGQTASTNSLAAGVYGEATNAAANGGGFRNTNGAGITTWISYWGGTTAYGVGTSGQIYGSNGLVIAGLPKSFVTPHPEDPAKEIMYVAAEGPTSDVFFRGTARLRNGTAVIPIPDHFRLVAREGSYMTTVTSVGSNAGLYVETELAEGIVVKGSGNARFHYVVWGERDECRDHEAVRPNSHFTPDEMEKISALKTFPEPTRALLVRNGTLNPDGTYNRTTARRLGWNVPEPPESVAAPIDNLDAKKK